MNNFTEQRLVANCGTLLFRTDASAHEAFGFECMDGWADLIEGSLRLIQRCAELEESDVKITQVKEKFGLLRIYQSGGGENVCQILDICELTSGCLCELCGKAGKLIMLDGWMLTRCERHGDGHHTDQIELPSGDEHYISCYVRTVDSILSFFGADAVRWVQQECIGLGRKRPFEMLGTEEGCLAVDTLLKRLEYGVGA
ncbi:antitoxin Xre/MbcA/ParS toxin-binding domain-containing protein [Pseudomonas alkylphenolica]|uniref:antitoxin Xre/MbcA/ParS toxin-binding domain-containing protein n=1 Tax=Pseudomonas alkylphenolica TaxID=237609 RepID=UPI00315D888C